MIVVKKSPGVDGFRNIFISEGENKIDNSADLDEYLKLPRVLEKIKTGEYEIIEEAGRPDKKSEPPKKRKKGRKLKSEKNEGSGESGGSEDNPVGVDIG